MSAPQAADSPAYLAALHAQCFTTPRPWSADEFADLLAMRGCFLLTGPPHDPDPPAFLIGRVIADEAELLTLAVCPASRRTGLARELVQRFAHHAATLGAASAFLEVSADNLPAQALYEAAGWRRTGRRRDYYAPGTDALILSLRLGAAR